MAIRFFSLSLFIALACFYAFYKKSQLNDYLKLSESREIIQKLPTQLVFDDLTRENQFSPSLYFPKKYDRLFLHFWATWCGPCEKEFPELQNLITKIVSNKNAPKTAFVFVALNDKEQALKSFLKRFPELNKHVLFLRDENELYKKFLGVTRVPETWIFNRTQTVYKRLTGPQNWDTQYFYNLLSL